jgi:1,4-alpha-glucan branching enzyme
MDEQATHKGVWRWQKLKFKSNKGTLSLTNLRWQHYQSNANHDKHIHLRRPDVGHEVTVPHCRESDHHEIDGLEQVQISVTRSLEVLDTTNTAQIQTGRSVLKACFDGAAWLQNFVHRLGLKKKQNTRVSETRISIPVFRCILSDQTPYVPPRTLLDANRFSFE